MTTGHITRGPSLSFDKHGRPRLELRVELDYVDGDLDTFLNQAPAKQQITFTTRERQPRLFETP